MEQGTPQSIINTEQVEMLIGSAGIDTTKSILDAFWKSSDDITGTLKEQIAADDAGNASASAHALKGSAANLGATVVSERARMIETACREHDMDTARNALAVLQDELDKTRSAFDALLVQAAA